MATPAAVSRMWLSLYSADAEEYKAKMEEFSTFQPPFNGEKIKFLLEKAKVNMKNNKETLLKEIRKSVLRRQSRRGTTAP